MAGLRSVCMVLPCCRRRARVPMGGDSEPLSPDSPVPPERPSLVVLRHGVVG
jgi:hypothetical protein